MRGGLMGPLKHHAEAHLGGSLGGSARLGLRSSFVIVVALLSRVAYLAWPSLAGSLFLLLRRSQ